jgi:hypothetical protein
MRRHVIALSGVTFLVVALGCAKHAEVSSAAIGSAHTLLVMTRWPAHPFFREFHRRLSLSQGGSVVASVDMDDDTGGYSSAELFEVGPSEYVLRDAFDIYQVDPIKRTIVPLGSSKNPALLLRDDQRIGWFKDSAEGSLTYISKP